MEAAVSRTAGNRRTLLLIAVVFGPLALLPLLPPFEQPAQYHAFADARAYLGIPGFLNVVSNAAFLVVGVAGLDLCLRRKTGGAALSWLTFFVGVTIVAFGSTYYHWGPDDATLFWDRLPMTIAFVALFIAVLIEHGTVSAERKLLAVALVVGVFSVAWWRLTGDLKLYGWVQFAPFAAITLVLAMYPGRYSGRWWLALGFLFYALAKATELTDAWLFEATSRTISGHTLKHLLAALAPMCVYWMLRTRRRIG
jgi:hypothetical protein